MLETYYNNQQEKKKKKLNQTGTRAGRRGIRGKQCTSISKCAVYRIGPVDRAKSYPITANIIIGTGMKIPPIPTQLNSSYRRLKKDLVSASRISFIRESFELEKVGVNQHMEIYIILTFFRYGKDGRALDRAFRNNLMITVDREFPYSRPNLEIINQRSIDSWILRRINEHLKQYCLKNWCSSSALLQVLSQFTEQFTKQPLEEFVHVPFKLQYSRSKYEAEQSEDSSNKIPKKGAKTKRKKHAGKRRVAASLTANAQTKNLNRHFRSKLREILRDEQKAIEKRKQNNQSLADDEAKNASIEEILEFFKPNRVGFNQIRYALKKDWFNKVLQQQMKNGEFYRRILISGMNISSKVLMIKYYPIMQEAVMHPKEFNRWKQS